MPHFHIGNIFTHTHTHTLSLSLSLSEPSRAIYSSSLLSTNHVCKPLPHPFFFALLTPHFPALQIAPLPFSLLNERNEFKKKKIQGTADTSVFIDSGLNATGCGSGRIENEGRRKGRKSFENLIDLDDCDLVVRNAMSVSSAWSLTVGRQW